MSKRIRQEELRRAMNDVKKKMGAVKRIESPLVKYSESGQITCKICQSIIRNEAAWPAHINSKEHKNNIDVVRKTKLDITKKSSLQAAIKRSSTLESEIPKKVVKGILKNSEKPVQSVLANLPHDFFDKPVNNSVNRNNKVASCSSNQSKKIDEKMEVTKIKDGGEAALPEGFFDDPVLDAKARNVEYKNPEDEEWERFQKEIGLQEAQSAEIIADDQEVAASERYIDTIDEQLYNFNRVINLVKQKESFHKSQVTVSEESSDDDIDVDEFVDWRSKKSFR